VTVIGSLDHIFGGHCPLSEEYLIYTTFRRSGDRLE